MENPVNGQANGASGQTSGATQSAQKNTQAASQTQQGTVNQTAEGETATQDQVAAKYRNYAKSFFPEAFKAEEQAVEQANKQVQDLRQAALSPEDIDAIVERKFNERVAASQQQPTQVTQQQINALEPEAKATFLQLLRDGRNAEAEKLLISELRTSMAPDITKSIQTNVLNQVLSYNQAVQEIRDFEHEFYGPGQNQDLVGWKTDIDRYAKELMQGLVQGGKVKDVNQYINGHKACVVQATENLRNKLSGLRGEGKQEALTRQRDVLAQQTIIPGQVVSRNDGAANNAQLKTPHDYIAERQNRQAQMRGLAGRG